MNVLVIKAAAAAAGAVHTQSGGVVSQPDDKSSFLKQLRHQSLV